MKKGIQLALLLCGVFLFQGCIKDYIKDHHDHHDDDDEHQEDPEATVEISQTQLIVRFDANLGESEKAAIRAEYGIEDFQNCSCGDPNLELWGNATEVIDVEGVVRGLRGNSSAEGDFQFTFSVPDVEGFEPLGQEDPGLLESRIQAFDPDKVSIAVLDTGIDYFQDGSAGTFLYSTSSIPDACPTISGYNFVDGNEDVYDFHGHGTFVTKLITATLDNRGIGYQILPLKIFDGAQGSHWNVLCAVGYLKLLEDQGGNVDIVNASFGGTIEASFFDSKGLLGTMISELESDMLFVTSAGNEGLDTDNGPLKHFPSGYEADNLLAVGGFEEVGGTIDIHPQSNYGEISIDVAAPYADWTIQFETGGPINLEGTSFSTAYISALSGEYYLNNGTPAPVDLKIDLLGTSNTTTDLDGLINGSRYIDN